MNLKILFLCFNAVAATSHNHHHLRHQSEQHEIVFRATKGQLRRLLKGQENTPSKDLEALHALRGGSQRFLKTCSLSGIDWDCDKDTEKCGNAANKCKKTCDEKKDCHDNGKCKNGKCDCYNGFEDKKDCSQQDIIYNINLGVLQNDSRSAECTARLFDLGTQHAEEYVDGLPSTRSATSSKSRRTRNRRLSHSSKKSGHGAHVVDIYLEVDGTCDGATAALAVIEGDSEASGKTLDVDADPAPPAPYECLLEESEDLLKDADSDKEAKDLEVDLNGLVAACNVTAEASCVEECHNGMDDECEDEIDDEEDDCKGLHNDLKRCYKECFGL